jgi:hypothetical protein
MANDKILPNTLVDIQIFVKEIELPAQAYEAISIVGDIDFIYNGGALVLNDVNGTFIDSAALRIGDFIKIVFTFSTENTSTPKKISTEMCIHSIHQDDEHKKTYDNGGGYYIYKLISPAFYSQIPANRGYKSSTSDIIRQELNLINWKFNSDSTEIQDSDDSMSRRYLLNERPLSFIKKISMKASIEGSASLCYVDELNGFHFTSLNKRLTEIPTFSLVSPMVTGSNQYSPIIMDAFNIRLYENLDSWNTQKILYNQIDISNNSVSSLYMTSLVPSGSEVFLNELITNNVKFTSQYSAPADGVLEQKAMSLQYQKDQLHNFVVEVSLRDAVGKVKTGDMVELVIPSSLNVENSSSYSGKYIIKRCEHKIESLQSRSSLILVKIATPIVDWTVQTATPGSTTASSAQARSV